MADDVARDTADGLARLLRELGHELPVVAVVAVDGPDDGVDVPVDRVHVVEADSVGWFVRAAGRGRSPLDDDVARLVRLLAG